jgi:hypothetical protein
MKYTADHPQNLTVVFDRSLEERLGEDRARDVVVLAQAIDKYGPQIRDGIKAVAGVDEHLAYGIGLAINILASALTTIADDESETPLERHRYWQSVLDYTNTVLTQLAEGEIGVVAPEAKA